MAEVLLRHGEEGEVSRDGTLELSLMDLVRAQERLQRLLIVADAVVSRAQRIQEMTIFGFKLTGFLTVTQGLTVARHREAR
jgi:hypothetical protein